MNKELPFQTALITGATSGIGLAFAHYLAEQGIQQLILTARNEEKLRDIKSALSSCHQVEIRWIGLDLSEEKSCEQLARAVKEWGWTVDCLINNAGFTLRTEDEFLHPHKVQQMIQLMAATPVYLCQVFGKTMADNNHGYILNVSSIVGNFPVSSTLSYCAIKRFLNAYSHSLSYEWRSKKVHVTCLQPGATLSEFHANNHLPIPKSILFLFRSPAQVAKSGIQGLIKGKRNVFPGFENIILLWVTRIVPHSWLYAIHKNIWRKNRGKWT